MTDDPRIPIGSAVRHRDAPEASAITGTIIARLKPSVGAPRMVRVQWNAKHSAPVNERNLRVVAEPKS